MNLDDYARESAEKLKRLQLIDFEALRSDSEAERLADDLADGIGLQSATAPGVAWAMEAFESLSNANPGNVKVAVKYAGSLVQLREHGADRATLQTKLARLEALHQRFPSSTEISGSISLALANMGMSEWVQSTHADVARQAEVLLETVAEANPNDPQSAKWLALKLQEEARAATTTEKREAAVARIKDLHVRFPNEQGITDVYQLTARKSGCYVATAVYGSYDCPEVWVLRRYRDDRLSATWMGRGIVAAYYRVSPALVRRFGKDRWFGATLRPAIDRIVCYLRSRGIKDTPYTDAS